jgi:hypothetical protein
LEASEFLEHSGMEKEKEKMMERDVWISQPREDLSNDHPLNNPSLHHPPWLALQDAVGSRAQS